MNKNMFKYLLMLTAVTIVGGGCNVDDYNNEYLDGFEGKTEVTDVKAFEYTLSDADYASVAGDKTNQAIAKAAGKDAETALAAIKKDKYFTPTAPASTYLPALLASKYNSYLSNGSSVMVTYNTSLDPSTQLAQYRATKYHNVTAQEYQKLWDNPLCMFTKDKNPVKNLPAMLAAAYPDAEENQLAWVDYYYDAQGSLNGISLAENFEFDASLWTNLPTKGKTKWAEKTYSGNAYFQNSGYNASGDEEGNVETYLISPAVKIGADSHLTFDACYGNYKADGGRISVLISENLEETINADAIAKASWTDITSAVTIPVPTSTYGVLSNVCNYDMAAYAGKTVHIAFVYRGDTKKATTTVQVDNIVVKTATAVVPNPAPGYLLFRFTKSQWKTYSLASGDSDLEGGFMGDMGFADGYFPSAAEADKYLPQFLSMIYPYAQEKDIHRVMYKYKDKAIEVGADEYTYENGQWTKFSGATIETAQFIKNSDGWVWDPSMTIVLSPTANTEISKKYYQAAVNWVLANKDAAYTTNNRDQSRYSDQEYFSGCSAGYYNLNWRINTLPKYYWSAAGLDVTAYADWGSDDIEKSKASYKAFYETAEAHFGESMAAVLGILHGDVKMIPGVDVIYTVQAYLYTQHHTDKELTHAFEFKLVDNGKFEYVRMYALDPKFELLNDSYFK